uniref:Uncharacterized protein n=1 Tax=Fagus sylvatica TaxID=28930 RepID=A0A2N9FQY5_FAGSY
MAPRTEATGVFLVRLRAVFRSGFRLDPDKFLAIREFHVVHGMCLLSNVPGLADQLVASQEDSARKRGNVGGKIPEISAQPYFVGLFSRAWPCTEASLGSQDMILRTEAVGMFLMPRGVVSSIQFSVWSTVRSNLGQTWSTLVKLGRIWSKLSKLWEMYPGLHFEGFWAWWVLVGLETARSNLGQTLVNPSQTWSTLVKLGQTLGNVSRTFFLGVFDVASPSSDQAGLVRAVSFCVPTPEKIPVGTAKNLPQFACHSLSDALALNRLTHGSKVKVDLALRKVRSPFLSCKSGGSTVWNLSPNKLRGDLTWGLPKLQIGWFNGLESQSKQVEDCKSGGSTVWNLSPNKLRSDLTWGLPKLQIGWFNGLESQSKQVEGCKSGGSTVWNLSPNKLRSDLTWGLPKLQIGCLTDVVVAEIVAGPHALDSCECMNIEGAMRAPLRWLLLCLLGRSALASHTLGLAIS